MWNAWIVGLVGIWMVIASYVAHSTTGNAWNDWVFGIIAAVVGFTMTGDRSWERPLAGIVGVWLFISGFIPALRLGHGRETNDLILGVLLIIAGFAATRRHAHGMQTPPQPLAH